MIPDDYVRDLEKAVDLLRRSRDVIVVHHDDADGLAAGAIALSAASNAGLESRAICIEKMHPAILRKIHDLDADVFIYADIGSGRADIVASSMREGQRAIILDHHDPVHVEDERILHLNPELYGYSGESEASGSTAAYLLFRALAPEVAGALAWAAVVGSAEIPGPLKGLNRIPLDDAVREGDVDVRMVHNSEKYLVKHLKLYWNRASSSYTVLGSVGYYSGGPEKAVGSIIDRRLPSDDVKRLEEERSHRFKLLSSRAYRGGIKRLNNVQWFEDGGILDGLGTKTIGTFSSILRYKRIVDPGKYLIGMMRFPRVIPGLGEIEDRLLKVSIRLPQRLSELVKGGRRPPASMLLVEASSRIGGVADGHAFAASALIPEDKRDHFLEGIDGLAGSPSIDLHREL